MMAIMQDSNSNQEQNKEFLETGRTGRRNAMPDIMHPQGAEVTTAGLPERLAQLATEDGKLLSDFYILLALERHVLLK